ncbi:hypothetical protein BX600DRAFT_476864 [Xylariales sp. PMI_506]|nr:hypothetical protein BX600DRAFT_476864 [Xylariales sp. PMI_506]
MTPVEALEVQNDPVVNVLLLNVDLGDGDDIDFRALPRKIEPRVNTQLNLYDPSLGAGSTIIVLDSGIDVAHQVS